MLFYDAFMDLIADRNWEWGLIPWTARQRWAETHGLDVLATRLLHTHIAAMDVAFLEWRSTKAKENRPAPVLPPTR